MKNKPQGVSPCSETKVLDWLYQEEQGDDFLVGKTPQEFQDSWEDEE